MGRFIEAVKAGVKAFNEEAEPKEYSIAGRPVRCPHCDETKFAPGMALLSSRFHTAFDPSATILVCAECGRIEWFARESDAGSRARALPLWPGLERVLTSMMVDRCRGMQP